MSSRMQEMYYSLDDDSSIPSADSTKLAKSGPMLNDCFFGNEGYDPSLPLTKSQCEDLILNALSEEQENTVPGSGNVWVVSEVYEQPGNGAEDGAEQWADLKNVNHLAEDWLEEWMDLNGIFDPSVEVPCFDFDIPECQSSQQTVQESGAYVPQCLPSAVAVTSRDQVVQQEFSPKPSWDSEQELGCTPAVQTSRPKSIIRGQKVTAREYILRPIPKCVELAMPPLPDARRHVRSAKVAKASVAHAQDLTKNTTRTPKSSVYRTMTERKREQNRSAAIRYREKRREETKRKKEEMRDLELRNVALKTEVTGLSTEIDYLKKLLHDVIGR